MSVFATLLDGFQQSRSKYSRKSQDTHTPPALVTKSMNFMSIVEPFVCVASGPNLDSDIQEKLDFIVVTDLSVYDNPKLLGRFDYAPSIPSVESSNPFSILAEEEQFDSGHYLANTTTPGVSIPSLNSR